MKNYLDREDLDYLFSRRFDWGRYFDGLPVKTIKKGEYLFTSGEISDSAYYVVSGIFKRILYDRAGFESNALFAQPGSLIGEQSLIARANRFMNLQAVEDAEVACMSAEQFFRLLETDREFMHDILQYEIKKVYRLRYELVSMTFHSARSKIAAALLSLNVQYGEPSSLGVRISARVTKKDIANISGTSRVTVTKEMKKMEETGILCRQNGHFHLLDMDALHRLADTE